MSDVFVSYKAEDRKRVRRLVEALEADGLSVWWDAQIGGGDEWRRTIEEQLDSAPCVLVVWSKRSTGSEGRFVRDEASRAMERSVYLPVRIDDVRLPLGFGETQVLSLVGWNGDRANQAYEAVLDCIHSIQSKTPLSRPARTSGPRGTNRRTALGATAAAVAAAAVGGWAFFRSPRSTGSDSIAVLPFANLSGDPAQAYFSDGMAEELRNALSRIAQLKVVARTSSEAVRDEDAKTAAAKLGVSNILTGSIRRSASTIRISAQLIDGKTGLERWAQSFDRPFGDVLAIQSNIAESVASALSVQLGRAGKEALQLGGTTNVEAHDRYLRADFARISDSAEGLRSAIADLNVATDLDPNFADAYARKAFMLNVLAGVYASTPAAMTQGLDDAEQSAKRAIEIAPRLASGHSALASCYQNRLRFRDCLNEFRLAVSLPGADSFTIRGFAILLAQFGNPDGALAAVARANALDPLSPGRYEVQARVYYQIRRYALAIDNARRTLAATPNRARIISTLANSLFMLGKYGESKAEFLKLPANEVHREMGLAAIAARTGDLAGSNNILREIYAQFGETADYQYAQVYAQQKNADQAIASLMKAARTRDPGLAGIRTDPFLDPIRNDPRLTQIIARLDFPS